MQPTEQLRNEHEAVRTGLAILLRLQVRMDEEPGSGQLADDAGHLIEFFQVFVDRCHHGKEEQLLFPLLEAVGVGRSGGPIGVMLHEHDQGRAAIRGMTEALAGYREGTPGAAARFGEHARAYAALLDQHIAKENNVLFVLAEQHLSREQLDGLALAFDRLEEEEIGSGRHEAFHRQLEELVERYLA